MVDERSRESFAIKRHPGGISAGMIATSSHPWL
jgi:hypothetical protein